MCHTGKRREYRESEKFPGLWTLSHIDLMHVSVSGVVSPEMEREGGDYSHHKKPPGGGRAEGGGIGSCATSST